MQKSTQPLTKNQEAFIGFLLKSQALQFGSFVLKSGRHAAYFVNMGKFDSGSAISELGEYYAAHINEYIAPLPDLIFGPAYKGIPLAVTTAAALYQKFGKDIGYTFDRKEEKDHGDGGKLVGRKINSGDRVVIVEDVVTAGTTLRQVVPFLTETLRAKVVGVVVAVDRQEKGSGEKSAIKEAEDELGVKVFPIVQIRQIIDYLSKSNPTGYVIPPQTLDEAQRYLETYGS